MIKNDKNGGRAVDLYIPFEFKKQTIATITFSPLKLGHVLLWNEGHWKNMIEFMTELAGVEEAVIRELRYPDADRVTEAFMSLLTQELRNDIEVGRVPQKQTEKDKAEAQQGANDAFEATQRVLQTIDGGDGSGMTGPGVPLPPSIETGFDMGEEP
jgi:hypothetical protein